MPSLPIKSFDRKAFLTLASVGLLERAAYFGFISSFALYLINPEEGFGLADGEVGNKYALFSYIGLGTLVLAGPLADFLVPKHQQFRLGFLVLILGYLSLLLPGTAGFMSGAICITIGSAIINVGIYPRLGELYAASSPKRDAGFAGFGIILSFAAIISTITVIAISGVFGFKAGFISCAILSGLALIICSKSQHEDRQREMTLTTSPSTIRNAKLPLFIILLALCFWFIKTMATNNVDYQLMMSPDYNHGSLPGLPMVSLQTVSAFMVAALGLFFFILLYFKKMGDSLIKLLVATLILTIGTVSIYLFSPFSTDQESNSSGILSILLIIVLAEVIFIPIAMSFITKVSPGKYQNSLFGLFLFALRLSAFAPFLFQNNYQAESIVPDTRLLIGGAGLLLIMIPLLVIRQNRNKSMAVSELSQPPHPPE